MSQDAAEAVGAAVKLSPASASAATSTPTFTTFAPGTSPAARILSIQSSVVYGYVGNKASVFPLQLLGFDVDPLHTCQLSNHTGYAHWTGRRTTADELTELLDGLQHNGMAQQYSCLLTGYCSNTPLLTRLLHTVRQWRLQREQPQPQQPQLLYFCDPVMGDNNKLYVPAEFVSLYSELIAHADVIAPNQTEAELLTGHRISTLDDAEAVCAALHEKGAKMVIITSITLPADCGDGDEQQPSQLHIIASQSASLLSLPSVSPSPPLPSLSAPLSSRLIGSGVYHLRVPYLSGYWSGTGDLVSALLLGWLLRTGGDLQRAVSSAITSVQAVMRRTRRSGSSELQLVQSRDDLLRPDQCEIKYEAEWRSSSSSPSRAEAANRNGKH